MRTSRRHVVTAAAGIAALVLNGAAAGYQCHRAPAGTRVLFVHGQIVDYSAAGTRVTFTIRTSLGCRTGVWDVRTLSASAHRVTPCATSRPERSLAAARGVRVDAGNAARPPALVLENGHRWPLPARPRTLAVLDGIAVFSAFGGAGLFAVRLSDGEAGLIGPNRADDVPQLTTAGVFYQDDEFKRDAVRGIVRLKFVPTHALQSLIDQAQLPLVTHGPVASLAMDGPRVALAVRDPDQRCDRVLYWNVEWRPAQRISAPDGPTCVLRRYTTIDRVAIGGFRAAWLRSAGSTPAIVAGSPKCQEWVIRRLRAGAGGDTVTALAGDGQTLAYAITHHERELRGSAEIGVVSGRFRAFQIASRRGVPQHLAVDGRRVAVSWDDGTVDVVGVGGRHIKNLEVGRAEDLVLAADRLVILRPRRLDVYSLRDRRRSATWGIPRDVVGVDVHYGIAVIHSRHLVQALDLATGHRAVLGRAPSAVVDAQIESAGVAYAYNLGSRGVARFVPIAAVMRQTGSVNDSRSRG